MTKARTNCRGRESWEQRAVRASDKHEAELSQNAGPCVTHIHGLSSGLSESCFLKGTRYSQNHRGGVAESARVHPHTAPRLEQANPPTPPARPQSPQAPRQPGPSKWAAWGYPSPGGCSQRGSEGTMVHKRGPLWRPLACHFSSSLSTKNQLADLRKKWEILFEPDVRVVSWEEHLGGNYNLHLLSTKVKPRGAAAADFQHPLRGVQGREQK